MHCIIQDTVLTCSTFQSFFAYGHLSFGFLRRNHDKVSATELGPLVSTQLPFTGNLFEFAFSKLVIPTSIVIPFSEWKGNKKTSFDSIPLNYWIILDKINNLDNANTI